MREYHCWSYEGFHQRVKKIADASNFRNVSKRIVEYFCLQFGCVLGLRPEERARWVNLC